MTDEITLIDGRKLECYPLPLSREFTQTDDIALDTTGRYLQFGSKAHFHTDSETAERRRKAEISEKLFYKHAHLFLANADKILSDSRLFLTPVNVENGLAYTGTSGLRAPTLGIYIEWWLHYKEASIDEKGRPIWFISGSPLSGCHACSAVDRKGKLHKAQLSRGFSSVWTSFMKVNRRYTEVKGKYIAYDLSEAIDLLEKQTDERHLFRLHIRLEQARYDSCISKLKETIASLRKQADDYRAKIRRLILDRHRDAAKAYYNKCLNLRTVAKLSRENFRQSRIERRKALRAGEIDNNTYQKLLTPLRKKADEAEAQCHIYEYNGLREVFGEDSIYLSFDTIEGLLTETRPD